MRLLHAYLHIKTKRRIYVTSAAARRHLAARPLLWEREQQEDKEDSSGTAEASGA